MNYEVCMGLEVHMELSTASKMFCGCSAAFGADANENVCPACAGMPGMPPVLNKKAVELGIAAGIITHGKIAERMTYDKKSYFYPDLPAGFQVTQYYAPICRGGYVEIETGQGKKRITLKQIHMEEDAGKLVHGLGSRTNVTRVDFNRTSVCLLEVVSNADFRSAEEVLAYLEKLRSLFSFAGISDCKMQEGSMRCDVNLSVREAGTETLGTRTEMKNLNSLRSINAAIAYESQRHIEALRTGGETLVQETRRWDEAAGETFPMREKEDATDYRYFPHPEVMPVRINDAWIQSVRASLPESAEAKYERLTGTLGLSEYDAKIITNSRNLSRIFDETMRFFPKPKEIANWIISELLAIATGDNKGEDDIAIDCEKFASLMSLVDNKTINRNVGKKILVKVLEEQTDPAAYVRAQGLEMVSDASVVEVAVKVVVEQNPGPAAEYRNGSQKVLGFFVGRVMKELGGKGDPEMVNRMLKNFLEV